jgi:hypothetical protein
MNKLWGDSKEGRLMICVLEPGNIERMKKAQPIQIDLNDGPYKHGLPAKLKLLILYSETPVADAQQFEKWLAPEGVEIEDQRTPVAQKMKPHCPECKSTIEQMGVWRNDSPVWLTFCVACGCVLGSMPPAEALGRRA